MNKLTVRGLGLVRIRCLELISKSNFLPEIGVMIIRADGVTTRIAHWCQDGKSRIISKELTRDELVHLINRSDYVFKSKKEIHERESFYDYQPRTEKK